jgi:hypothetical protein
MKIYIACALTAVPRSDFFAYADFIHKMAAALKQSGCGSVRYALVDSDPQLAEKPPNERASLCYTWDREMVQQADVLVADATYPSIGLGIELQIAEARNIPIILCFRKTAAHRLAPVGYENPDHSRHTLQIGDGYVSLMALGLPSIFRTVGYEDDDDGIRRIIEAVSLFIETCR